MCRDPQLSMIELYVYANRQKPMLFISVRNDESGERNQLTEAVPMSDMSHNQQLPLLRSPWLTAVLNRSAFKQRVVGRF